MYYKLLQHSRLINKQMFKIIKLYKIISSLLPVDDVCDLIFKYLEKNLWEYGFSKVGTNGNADSCESWQEYKEELEFKITRRHGVPAHFYWQCATELFLEDSPPYEGDVLFLDFLEDYSIWIKVKKDDQRAIIDYLESNLNFLGRLDITCQ